MPIQITVDQFTTFAAEKWMDFQHPTDLPKQRNLKMNAVKYNTLVTAFNGSTCATIAMAVGALVGAVFASTAILWGAIALFVRNIAERQIDVFALTDLPKRSQTLRAQRIQAEAESRALEYEMDARYEEEAPRQEGEGSGFYGALAGLAFGGAAAYPDTPRVLDARKAKIIDNCGIKNAKNWVENEVSVFGYSVLKNTVTV